MIHVMTINTPPLNRTDAEAFGKALGQYAIEVTALGVTHLLPGGKRKRDDPLAETIKETAGSFGAGLGISPVAFPLIGLLPVIPLPALIVALIADIKALYNVNKRNSCPPGATSSEVTFRLSGVSEKRLGWTQYLIGAYCQLHNWEIVKAQNMPQAAAGGRYAARTGRMPQPWSSAPSSAKRLIPASHNGKRGWLKF